MFICHLYPGAGHVVCGSEAEETKVTTVSCLPQTKSLGLQTLSLIQFLTSNLITQLAITHIIKVFFITETKQNYHNIGVG